MYSKICLLCSLLSMVFFTSCEKDAIIVPKPQFTVLNEKVAGTVQLVQKSFTPVAFDSGNKATKAKIVQELNGTLNIIGKITSTLNVDFDLVNAKSGEVLTFYVDKDGDKIYTTSSSVGNATGITITETIMSGTGKFAKITGSGTYFIKLDFATGSGSGVLEWTVTY